MNIEKLKQLIEIMSVLEEDKYKKCNSYEGYKIIRTYSSGVFSANIVDILSQGNGYFEVKLTNARRLWKWHSKLSLSDLAKYGVKDASQCKFSAAVDNHELPNVIEIISCTPEAECSIKGIPEWES